MFDEPDFRRDEVSRQVIGCAFDVHNALGPDQKEHIYRDALHDLIVQDTPFDCEPEVEVPVMLRGKQYGTRFVDLVVDETLVIELKAINRADLTHFRQLGTNVRHAQATRGLLLNFGAPRLDIWRYEPPDGDEAR